MGDNEVPQPHPGLQAAEQRVRAAIEEARARGEAPALALRHAELGLILAAQRRHRTAADEYQTALGYVEILRAEGSHEQQRLLRMTSPAAPPPGALDIDLDRLEVEIRVALVEAYAAAGDLQQANAALEQARPMTRGLFRRRLKRRLDRVAAMIAAAPSGTTELGEIRRLLAQAENPEQERALRLRLASGLLDSGDFDSALRESLLVVQSADHAGDARTRAGARQVLGLALEGLGREEEALPILSDAFRDLREQGDSAGMIGMAEALAHRLLRSGDSSGAARVLRSAEQAAGRAGDSDAALSAATMLGVVLDESGDARAAADVLAGAAARAERQGRPVRRADALHSAAVSLGRSARAEDLVEALSLLDEAKRLYAEERVPDRAAGCDHEAAALLGRHRSYDAAAARYEAALRAYEDLPEPMRDSGSWPDEVGDCRANLSWLAGPRDTPNPQLFQSGGHTMTHTGG
jgi:tetratricopeptide (TPR) repeat protein